MATADILALVDRWAAAEQQNDPDLVAELLADDFVGVGPVGFVLTRDQWLARFGNGLRNEAFAVEEPEVHHHGAAAVVVGVDAQRTCFAGGENSGRFRLTLVAVRSGDRWLVASVHIGPLQVPPGPPSPS